MAHLTKLWELAWVNPEECWLGHASPFGGSGPDDVMHRDQGEVCAVM